MGVARNSTKFRILLQFSHMTLCAAEPLPVWFVGAMAANSNWPGVLLLIHALLMVRPPAFSD